MRTMRIDAQTNWMGKGEKGKRFTQLKNHPSLSQYISNPSKSNQTIHKKYQQLVNQRTDLCVSKCKQTISIQRVQKKAQANQQGFLQVDASDKYYQQLCQLKKLWYKQKLIQRA
eukprot:TRINITY_DN212_c1_g1_i5.p11 TRINITY_DN212_c1_g1~~TRINITY_DN212_c1_g1_i5.p11  ORF type:complete len:114 (-),score=1.25 TRINITY_DN212_c1_g1_i5:405-746(-)